MEKRSKVSSSIDARRTYQPQSQEGEELFLECPPPPLLLPLPGALPVLDHRLFCIRHSL